MKHRAQVNYVSFSTILATCIVAIWLSTSTSYAQKLDSNDRVGSGRVITVAGWAIKSKIAAAWLLYPDYIKMNVVGSYAYPYYVKENCSGAKLKEAVASAVALVWKEGVDDSKNYTSGQLIGGMYDSGGKLDSGGIELAVDKNALCSSDYKGSTNNCNFDENTKNGKGFQCLFLSKKKLFGIQPKAVFWIDRPSYTFYQTKFGTKAVKKIAELEKSKTEAKQKPSDKSNIEN